MPDDNRKKKKKKGKNKNKKKGNENMPEGMSAGIQWPPPHVLMVLVHALDPRS